ncbi:MAG: restriction endonuclease subunit S [Methylococcaceae bacterium]
MNEEFPIFSGGWQTAKLRRKLRAADGIRIGPFGSALTLDQMVSDGYKVYGQENVISDDFTAGSRYITPSKYAELKACSINSGDLLVTMMGTTGRCCVVPKDIQVGIMDSHLIRLRFQKEIDPDFMALLIDKGHYIREQIGAAGKGTIMSGLNSAIIKDVWIGLPDLKVQRHLVRYVAEQTAQIDQLMDMRRRQMALLKEQRAAVIQEAVTRGLNPNASMKDSGLPWLGEIPAHWKLVPLKYLCEFSGGGTPSKENISYWTGGDIPWVSPKDMKTFWISDTQDKLTVQAVKESSTNFVESGALLMVVRSGILQRTIPIAINMVRVTLNQDMKALRFNLKMNVEFAANFILGLQDSLLLQWLKEGATVESIEHNYLSSSLFPLPPINEQQEIVAFIERQNEILDNIHAAYTRQLALLTEYRAALIHECVTGQRNVPETVTA